MSDDEIITPASRKIELKANSGNDDGKIDKGNLLESVVTPSSRKKNYVIDQYIYHIWYAD